MRSWACGYGRRDESCPSHFQFNVQTNLKNKQWHGGDVSLVCGRKTRTWKGAVESPGSAPSSHPLDSARRGQLLAHRSDNKTSFARQCLRIYNKKTTPIREAIVWMRGPSAETDRGRRTHLWHAVGYVACSVRQIGVPLSMFLRGFSPSSPCRVFVCGSRAQGGNTVEKTCYE